MPIAPLPNVDLFYTDSGAGVPILWLQGLGAEHSAWAPQIARFSVDFRCIAPDARDVGQSSRASQSYSLATLADDCAHLLAYLQLEAVHVVGLSLGGAVAQHLALNHPNLVRTLTLVSTFARQSPRQRELLIAWREIYARVDVATFYRQAAAWMFSDAFFERPRNLQNVLRYVAESDHPQEAAAFARQVDAVLSHDVVGRLSEISRPTLILGGDHDQLAPLAMMQTLADNITDSQLMTFTGSAHLINLERQIDFNRCLYEFIMKH